MVDVHPVARLLTPEMKARVRAATFIRDCNGMSSVITENDNPFSDRRCPLSIAVQLECSTRHLVYRALGVMQPHPDVESFMAWADSIHSNPEDVKVLLGCNEAASC